MDFPTSLMTRTPYIDWPFEWIGWIGWLILVAMIAVGLALNWKSLIVKLKGRGGILFLLLLLAPVTTLLLTFKIPIEALSILPNLPVETAQPILVLLFALPVVLAAGMTGGLGAVLAGFSSGMLLALFYTHNIFTPLESAGVGLLFSAAIGQNYRTTFYRFLRHPLAAALVVAAGFIPFYLFSSFFSVPGALAERLDFALTQNWVRIIARSIELIIAGGIGEILLVSGFRYWTKPRELVPSPAEVSLKTRFLHITVPVAVILMVVLVVGDWLAAGQAARRMVEERLVSSSKIAADSLPYFLETGQSLILDTASPELLVESPSQLRELLSERIRTIPYFRQLYVFDENKQPLTGYPEADITQLRLTSEENLAVDLALDGVLIQVYTVPPFPGERSAQIAFITSINKPDGGVGGVLLGRTDLESNPFTRPALNALAALGSDGGEGFILDDQSRVLYHTLASSPLTATDEYVGRIPEEALFLEDVSTTETRKLVYFQPVLGRPWSVVATLPAQVAQQIALEIAIPMMAILASLFILAFLLLRITLGKITTSLQKLSTQAGMIARGQLGSKLDVDGFDEVGQLSRSFEQMRTSLKSRLEELNKLLEVSQGVSASMEVEDAIKPILQGALRSDAVAARAVLIQEVTTDVAGDQLVQLGIGPEASTYAYLDNQIFELMRTQEVLTISNTKRVRRLLNPGEHTLPQALIAFGIYFKNTYFGTLWLAYKEPRIFTPDEVRYLGTLASEAAIAAANSRLYASAEVGRRRLEAVLASTPEPVLVFDERDHLLLLNPAAIHIHGLVSSQTPGRHVKDVVSSKELAKLIGTPMEERILSREIELGNGRIYHCSVAPVTGEDQPLGKVCVLRDITHYKELDSIKSDFVATVSHDLRTPLMLMRGYATMLTMVGELNEQQKNYVAKMVTGIENMSHLVGNLLDLGRIEAGISLNLEEVSAAEIVEKVLKQHQPHAAQKNITLTFEDLPEGKSPYISVDVALIQQALVNLVENAIKFTGTNGQVTVRLKQRGDKILFEIQDTGIGIAPLDVPRLFEKFHSSGQRDAQQVRGTGLGLAIVKSIVDRHHGRVWAESFLGRGSTFFIELPQQLGQMETFIN